MFHSQHSGTQIWLLEKDFIKTTFYSPIENNKLLPYFEFYKRINIEYEVHPTEFIFSGFLRLSVLLVYFKNIFMNKTSKQNLMGFETSPDLVIKPFYILSTLV